MIHRLLNCTAVFAGVACATAAAAVAAPFVPHQQVVVAPAAAAATVRFTVHLPLHNRGELQMLVRLQGTKGSPLYRHFLTPRQFRNRFGVTAADVAAARAAFAPDRLRVVDVGAQDITLEGAAADVQRSLGTTLGVTISRGATRVVAQTALRLPAALAGANVVGLSGAVLRHTHSELLAPTTAAIVSKASLGITRHSELSPVGGYLTSDLKQAYSYPSYRSLTGKGATIAILVDGDFFDADMKSYFGVQNLPVPTLVRRPVDGGAGTNDPDNVETELDIQQSGGMAPGATIVHYNIPDLTEGSIYDGYKAIVTDDKADVVNSSFGGCERYYNGAYVRYFGASAIPATLYALTDLYLQGDAQGQTFVASSGDYGAIACFSPAAFKQVNPDFTPIAGVENPASDPIVTAVGGTNLVTSFDPSSPASTYVRENAFGDNPAPPFPLAWGSGGGESTLFGRPPWQDLVGVTSAGRAVPDISGHMGGCPGFALQPCGPDRSSDLIAYQGGYFNVIGTSASSPDFAGLLALTIEAAGGRLGIISPTIYAYSAANGHPVPYFYDAVNGDNGLNSIHRPTKPGYDEVTGVGSVIGLPFTGLLTAEVAGDPGTPSNPGPTPVSNSLPTSATPTAAPLISVATVDESTVTPLSASSAGRSAQAARTAAQLANISAHHASTAIRELLAVSHTPSAATIDGGSAPGSAATATAAGFDGLGKKCRPFVCGPTRLGFAVSPSFVMASAWGASNDRSGVVNVTHLDGTPLAGWPKGIDGFLGLAPLSGCSSCFRDFQTPHAAYDAATGRFWYTVNELDADASGNGLSSTWVAVSKTSDPTGSWFVYHYNTDVPGAIVSGEQTGFGFDRDALYLSGKQLDNVTGAVVDSFVYALDKHAMESGAKVAARGFSRLSYGGALIDAGVVPVMPSSAADEHSGTYLVDTFRAAKGPVPCAVRTCNGILVWSFSDPLGTQRLIGRVAPTANYQRPLNFTGTDFQPLDVSIESTPSFGGGTIALAFSERLTAAGRRANAIRFVEIAPSMAAAGTLSLRTLEDRTLAPPAGRTLEFPATAHDPSGSTYVTYGVESFDRPDAIVYVKHKPDGTTTAPVTLFNAPGALLTTGFDLTGYGAATFQAGRVWTLQPYGDASGFISGWVTTVP